MGKNIGIEKSPFIRYLSSELIRSRLKHFKQINWLKEGVKMRMLQQDQGGRDN